MTQESKILQELNKIINTLQSFEIVDETLDLQEKIDLSKSIDGIKDVQEAYAARHKMCAKHAEHLKAEIVNYSKDNQETEYNCQKCKAELC